MITAYVRFSSLMLPEHAGARHVLALCLALLIWLADARAVARQPEHPAEVRALWVTRSALISPDTVAQMVSTAQNGGFNTIVCRFAAAVMRTIAALRAARRSTRGQARLRSARRND